MDAHQTLRTRGVGVQYYLSYISSAVDKQLLDDFHSQCISYSFMIDCGRDGLVDGVRGEMKDDECVDNNNNEIS